MTATQIWLYVLVPTAIGVGIALTGSDAFGRLAVDAQIVMGGIIGFSGVGAYVFSRLVLPKNEGQG